MSSASEIRIDSILYSLKELHNEKHCLEQKCIDRKSADKILERRIEHCNANLAQVKEMAVKRTEMQKVAAHKVAQTQRQVDSLHQYNQMQKQQICEENTQITQEKEKAVQIIEDFQDKMSDLAKTLNHAREFYKTDNLQSHIDKTRAKVHQHEHQVTGKSEEMKIIMSSLKKLELNSTGDTTEKTVSPQTRLLLWNMLEEEEQMVHASLQRLQTEQ